MSRLVWIAVVCLTAAGCAARAASSSAATANAVVDRSVRAHMQFLASDALNGRGSGTRDEWITATYIAAQFAQAGLRPLGNATGFVHEVRIERSELNAPPTLQVGERQLTHIKEMFVTSFAAPRIEGTLQKFTAGEPVRPGAVLLLPVTNPPNANETSRASIVLSRETDAQQKRRLAGSAPPYPPVRMQWIVGTSKRAAVALERSAYDALSALPDGTAVMLNADVKPAETVSTWNAVGELPGRGTQQNQRIVLSAHHDHVGNAPSQKTADAIYNGADDDASGTIAVLELASALARQGTNRTVVFATFGSEETGGQGSTHFIEASGIDLTTVVANLQFEMIGRPDPKVPPQTLWLTGYERSNLGETLAKRGARLVADPHPEQSFFTRSDNIRFARRGVVAHTVSSFGLHTDYHAPSDEIDTIDFPHMTRAIQSLVEPIRWLANSTFMPEWKPGMRP